MKLTRTARTWSTWSTSWMWSSTTIDVLVAAIVAFPTFMDAWWNEAGTRQADWITYSLAAISVGALLVRRRWPIAVAVMCGIALTAWYLMDHHGEMLNLPTMVALYTVALQGDRRTSIIAGLVAASWSGVLGYTDSDPAGAPGGSPVLEMIWPLVPLALGEAVRARQELLAEYATRAERAEAEREREAHHRVTAERIRIARDFHDVVAHTMAAVNVQMGVAVAAFDTQPDTARQALAQARTSSKEALQELRATIAVLRDDTPTSPLTPAPRLTQLDDLAQTARASGLTVTIHDHTEGHELPAAVELAAYRIVQEALTNVIRHAHACNAAVSLSPHGTGLVVEITDDGTPSSASPNATPTGNSGGNRPGGHGLLGMTERAVVLGGRLEHGPLPTGGFRVRAVLPTETTRR